jgi:hypothetical protein
MRSTPGCGTLAGPSLECVAFRSNIFAESPGLERPGVLGRPEMPGKEAASRRGRVQLNLKIYDMYIPDIYLSYMTAQ